MKHLHSLSIVLGKTGTTACGKRVKFADFALTEDADCPACRKHAEDMHAGALSVLAAYERAHGETELSRATRAQLSAGVVYRSALLGL